MCYVAQVCILLLCSVSLVSSFELVQIRPGVLIAAIKLGWGGNKNGTVSKFPPIIEYFVQRIQAQNSNYIHEDLSRPPTWDKPVYTLAPEDYHLTAKPQIATSTNPTSTQENLFYEDESAVNETTTEKKRPVEFEYEELEETTEKLFEIIKPAASDEMPC